jgi:excisionase family DNA binding protein
MKPTRGPEDGAVLWKRGVEDADADGLSKDALVSRSGGLPDLLTLDEVARMLRIHRNTVNRERREGRLGCVRIGRRVLVSTEQLRAFLHRIERVPPARQIEEQAPDQTQSASAVADASEHRSNEKDRDAKGASALARAKTVAGIIQKS